MNARETSAAEPASGLQVLLNWLALAALLALGIVAAPAGAALRTSPCLHVTLAHAP
jgi:hypothetical protein